MASLGMYSWTTGIKKRVFVRVANLAKENEKRVEIAEKVKNSKVVILGGTGRVGGSTAIALSKLCPDLNIVIAGRNREKGASMVSKLGKNAEFAEVNIDDREALEANLTDADIVVHAAGPFQQSENCKVLEAAIGTKVRERQPILIFVMTQAMQHEQSPI